MFFFVKMVACKIAATKSRLVILQFFSLEPIHTPTIENASTKVAEWSESIAFGGRDSELLVNCRASFQ